MQGLEPHLGEYQIDNQFLIFTNLTIEPGQIIDVEYRTKDKVKKNELSYFSIPKNLELNAKNSSVSSTTPSEMLPHFRSIIDNQNNLNGFSFGSNNFRDTSRDLGKGTGFLQYNYSMLPLMYMLTDTIETIINTTEYVTKIDKKIPWWIWVLISFLSLSILILLVRKKE